MSLGRQFENLGDRLMGISSPTPAQARMAFDDALSALSTGGASGGTLYVPPLGRNGRLYINVGTSPLVIPANVELEVAPGAQLIPGAPYVRFTDPRDAGPGAEIEIAGPFRAPMGQVFTTLPEHARLTSEPIDLGRVRFTNRAMDRVHPEWWGASGGAGDSDALDACIRAAVSDRYVVNAGVTRWLRPLVIELRGNYELSRRIVLGPEGRPREGLHVTLRGAPGGFDQPTFHCASGFEAGPMLSVAKIESLTLEDLRFVGGSIASDCVIVYSLRTSAKERGHQIVRCGFRGAVLTLVTLVSEEDGVMDASKADSVLADGVRDELTVEGCRFWSETAQSEGGFAAVLLSAPPGSNVSVRGCVFEGTAGAMIRALTCSLSVTNSLFHNRSVPPKRFDQSDEEDLHVNGPEGGLDVFLDQRLGHAPAVLYAQDCRSRSAQFLATCRSAPNESGRDCAIVGLHHDNTAALMKRVLGRAPAPIHWRLPEMSRAWLTLTGCRFDSASVRERGAVRGFTGCGAIADIGVFNGIASENALVQVDGAMPGSERHMVILRPGETP